MFLEMARGPLVGGGDGGAIGKGFGGGGGGKYLSLCGDIGALFLSFSSASCLGSPPFMKRFGVCLTGSKGFTSGWGRLLNCLMMSLI